MSPKSSRSIKRTIAQSPFIFGKFLGKIFKLSFFNFTKQIKDSIYSGWISCFLEKTDGAFIIEYPAIIKGHKFIKIGKSFVACARFRLEVFDSFLNQKFEPKVIIGNNVCFNFNCHVGCIERIEIGNNVLIGSNVLITDHFHGGTELQDIQLPPGLRNLITKGPVIIEDNVWIGENVSIMPGVTIGTNAVIGSNSVVTKSIPANSVVGGVPAKIIKIIK